MEDKLFIDDLSVPAILNGKLYINDRELEFILRGYAISGAGYSYKLHRTSGFNRIHRKTRGEKLWEEKTIDEQKNEFVQQLLKDLKFAKSQINLTNQVEYLLDRALDPLDPMSNFYKIVLIKLGANITDDGTIKVSKQLKDRLENSELKNTEFIDLIPSNVLKNENSLQFPKLDINKSLKIKFNPPF